MDPGADQHHDADLFTLLLMCGRRNVVQATEESFYRVALPDSPSGVEGSGMVTVRFLICR